MASTLTPVVGNVVRVTGTFQQNSVNADPAGTITFYVRDPRESQTTYVYPASQVVRDSVGVYHVDVSVMLPGTYTYRFEAGPGTGQAAAEGVVSVLRSEAL